ERSQADNQVAQSVINTWVGRTKQNKEMRERASKIMSLAAQSSSSPSSSPPPSSPSSPVQTTSEDPQQPSSVPTLQQPASAPKSGSSAARRLTDVSHMPHAQRKTSSPKRHSADLTKRKGEGDKGT